MLSAFRLYSASISWIFHRQIIHYRKEREIFPKKGIFEIFLEREHFRGKIIWEIFIYDCLLYYYYLFYCRHCSDCLMRDFVMDFSKLLFLNRIYWNKWVNTDFEDNKAFSENRKKEMVYRTWAIIFKNAKTNFDTQNKSFR